MTRKLLFITGLPVLIGALVAVPVGLVRGPAQWEFAAIAFGLCVPTGVVTLWLAEYLSRQSPYGRLLGLMIGTGIRLVVGFGGAVAVLFLTIPEDPAGRVGFLLWVLFAYLATLVTETALLARPAPAGAAKMDGGRSIR
ncbi:MAG: hypothetical protein JWO38_7441 [Gemmataceae bacterium]|nr:hypothetical protein [Gemmataceae bacterium]